MAGQKRQRLALDSQHVKPLDRHLSAEDLNVLERLHELNIRLFGPEDLDTLLAAVNDVAIELSGADVGTLQLYDAVSDSLRIVAHRGLQPMLVDRFAVVHQNPAISVEAMRRGERTIVQDIATSSALLGTPAQAVLESAGVRSLQSTPMIGRDGKLRGALATYWSVPHQPGQGTLRLVDLLARKAVGLIEYRQREEALRQSEQRYRNLVLASPDAIVVHLDGQVLYANPAALDFYGAESLQHLAAYNLIQDLIPDAEKQLALERTRLAQQGQNVPLREGHIVRLDGQEVPMEVVSSPVQFEGILAVQVMFRDITARKRAEEALRAKDEELSRTYQRLQALMKAVPVGVSFSDDATCQRISGNPAGLAQFEVGPDDNLSASATDPHAPGRRVRFFHNGLPITDAELPLQRAVAENCEIPPMELEVQLPSGKRWCADISAAPIRDAHGNVVGGVAVSVDVTERKRFEEQLQQAKAAAESANLAKSQFLASMSHELRTPMTAILGMTDLALSEQISPTARDYLQTAKESADLLLELLNEILDFSRIEAGRFELETTPFSLRKVVQQVIKTLSVRAHEKGLELVCLVPDSVPDRLVGDPLRLRQIFVNLVGNAIKFTSKGEVVVRVEPISSPQATGQVVTLHCSVTDTGIGIAPENLGKIFSPFTQADSATTRRFGGTGLGLAISQRLVGLMGSQLVVESQPGKGSTFHFTISLPVVAASAEPDESAPERDLFQGLPILVVAENATNRRILVETLASWAMCPDEASDVPSALARIHEAAHLGRAYRLVLSDALLPGIDGFTLARWLDQPQRLAGPVILMISSADRDYDEQLCRDAPALCLEKPVSRSVLFNAVARIVGVVETAPDRTDLTPVATAAPLRNLRVLLVEDTPANQKLVRHVLQNRGHRVDIAHNGRQALELVQQDDFDVALMDVQMPEMDGFQTTAVIRKLQDSRKARLPIIAMTAHAMKGDRDRCLAAGMDDYISKPIRGEEMIELVERLAQTAETARQAVITKPHLKSPQQATVSEG